MGQDAFFIDYLATSLLPRLVLAVLVFAVVVGVFWRFINNSLRG